jgi:transposase
MPKHHSRELVKMAGQLYLETGSGHAVAKKLGVALTTVYRLIHRSGVPVAEKWGEVVSEGRKKIKKDQVAAVVKDYQEGMSNNEMIKKYNVGYYSIKTALKSAGVTLRDHGAPRRRVRNDEASEIARLYTSEKWTQQQIAASLGCHQTVISRVLKEQGVDCNNHKTGEEHGSWQGGLSVNDQGYILERIAITDPMAAMRNRSGYVLQHRLVMARHLGRPLSRNESVHHINGDRKDNRIENLQMRHGKHGAGVCLVCANCGSANIIEKELS